MITTGASAGRRAVGPDEDRVVDLVERAFHRHAAFDELVGREIGSQRVDQLFQVDDRPTAAISPEVRIVGHQ